MLFCSTAPKKKKVELVIPLQKQNAWAKPKPKPAAENGDGPAVTTTKGGDAAAGGAGAAKPGDDGKLDVELSLEERAIKALNDSQSCFELAFGSMLGQLPPPPRVHL